MKEIELGRGIKAIVDDEDYEWLNQWKWCAGGRAPYTAQRRAGKFRVLLMHRMVMSCPAGKVVDHINGNSLDNRKANLRICRQGENARNAAKRSHNKSGFKGVWWHPQSQMWRAVVRVNGKNNHIGLFKGKEDAARAYDQAAVKLHGEFARTNAMMGLL